MTRSHALKRIAARRLRQRLAETGGHWPARMIETPIEPEADNDPEE